CRCPCINPANDGPDKTPAQVGSLYLDGQAVFQGRHYRLVGRRLQWCAGERSDLASHTTNGKAVSAVRCELERKNRIVQIEIAAQILAYRRISSKLQQPGMILRQPQLTSGAQHAGRLDATPLHPANFHASRELCADTSQGHFHARSGTGSPANDLQGGATPIVHLANTKAIGIGMRLYVGN